MDDIALKPRSFAPERGTGRGGGQRAAIRALRGWPPLYAWRARRRIIVAGVVALAAWLLATTTGTMADSDGRHAAETALADAQHKLADARRQIAALPALRQAALVDQPGSSANSDDSASSGNLDDSVNSASPTGLPGQPTDQAIHPSSRFAGQLRVSRNPRNASMTTTTPHPSASQRAIPLPRASAGPRGMDYSAADVRHLSQLAAATGVVLMSLEPGAESRDDAQRTRLVKLTAQADFAHLNAFLRQLQTLPTLVVPAEITVKRHGDSLSITAMLRIFDGLRAPSPTSDAMPVRQTQPERQTQQQADASSPEDSFRHVGTQPAQQIRQMPQARLLPQIQQTQQMQQAHQVQQGQQIQRASQIQQMPQTQRAGRSGQVQQAPPAQQTQPVQQARRTHDHKPMSGPMFDPFGPPLGDAPDSGALRLAGVIADRANAVALVETPQGTQAVRRGSPLGSERVIQVGIPKIVLSHGDAMRTLTWEENADAQ